MLWLVKYFAMASEDLVLLTCELLKVGKILSDEINKISLEAVKGISSWIVELILEMNWLPIKFICERKLRRLTVQQGILLKKKIY